MHVLKVEAEGPTASFRYPFFMAGRQPTFEMPPPATIYGYICSALGEWIDPASLQFAYWFDHAGKSEDLEHFQAASVAPRSTFAWHGNKVSKNIEATVQPVRREFLFRPRLTLYLNNVALAPAFRSPRYAVTLGRSQDLFSYTRVTEIDLQEATSAYIDRTLLPGGLGRWSGSGIAVAMPRYIDYSRGRRVSFGQYVMVPTMLRPDLTPHPPPGDAYLIDPETEERDGCRRAVILHRFVDDE